MKTNLWFAWDVLFEFVNTCKTQNLQIQEVILSRFHQHQGTIFHLVISIRKVSKISVKRWLKRGANKNFIQQRFMQQF